MGMQGWRRTQEDSHIAHIGLEPGGNCLFGVFDGHGGEFSRIYMTLTDCYAFISRPRSSSVRQKAFCCLASEVGELQEQMLQGSIGGMLPQDGRTHGDKAGQRRVEDSPKGQLH